MGLDAKAAMRYFDAGPIPLYFGVCLSEQAFTREMKRLNVEDPPSFVKHGADAQCCAFEKGSGEWSVIISADAQNLKKTPQHRIAALFAHEASHAADYAIEAMRDDSPSGEMRACLVQWFTQCALRAFDEHKKRKTRR